VRVDADAGAGGHVEARQRPLPAWRALRVQRLGVDAPLDGAALRARRRGGPGRGAQALARRQPDLRLHQVDAEHLLGDGVLHLQARVGLDEDEGQAGGGGIDQELEGAQALVAHRARHRSAASTSRWRSASAGRAGRDLHQLLEAPLQRAFALAQRHRVVPVAQHLHLDVARAFHQALDVHAVDAEGRAPRRGSARRRRPARRPCAPRACRARRHRRRP
jgi:hypothetical protein